MKKLLKIVLTLMIITLVAITITGCSSKEDSNLEYNSTNEDLAKTEENTENSKTFNILNEIFSGEDYVMTLKGKTDIGEGEEEVTMTVASKGENIYMDVSAPSQHATIMYKNGTTYIISHDEEACVTMQGKDEETFNEDSTFISKEELQELEKQEYKIGKETIDGTEYEYEEFKNDEENITDRYYFSNSDLKYIKSIDEEGNEELMEIVKLSSEVDDSLFSIPTGYEVMTLDSLN